jgi:DNA adenine methylase
MNDDGRMTDGGSPGEKPSISGRGAFPYPGSKGQLAGWIIDTLPDHHCYVEPFGGSAAVLLQKPKSTVEVFNDTDGDIVHFFEVLRDRKEELVTWLRETPFSRDLHRKYAHEHYAGYRPDDGVERAGRWFYLRNTQFAQKYTGFSGFRLAKARNHARAYQNRVDRLEEIAARLRHVQLANRDYVELVERTDDPDTLFYFDPPYVDDGDDLYSHAGAFDHERFVDVLEEIDGQWITSYTELPSGLEDGYHVVSKDHRGTMRTGQGEWTQENTERLVMNFDPERTQAFVNDSLSQQRLTEAF